MGEDLLTCNVLKNKPSNQVKGYYRSAQLYWCLALIFLYSEFSFDFIFSYITLDQISFWLHFFPSDLDVDHLSGWGSVQLFSWHVLEKGSLLMNVWTNTENMHDLKSLQFMWRAEEENIVHKASDI